MGLQSCVSERTQALFVTWDGPGSTYLEALFLPIFAALRARGFDFHILQFTWADATESAATENACRAQGMSYQAVTIWRRPVALGGLATALWGSKQVRKAIIRFNVRVVVPRSTLPALATILGLPRSGHSVAILLDADGLPHDERVEFQGASPGGVTYRLLRALERWSVRRADAVAVRTGRAATILRDRAGPSFQEAKFYMVPNGRDARIFHPLDAQARAAARAELGLAPDQPLLVYVGSSLKGKYRGEAMLRFFRAVRAIRPDARLLLLMPQHREAYELLRNRSDLLPACLFRSVAPPAVPYWVAAADLGLALIHQTFSMQAVSAIKVGEYLLCGVPVLASSGVGDSDVTIDHSVGLCLTDADEPSLKTAADWFVRTVLPGRELFRHHCREVGLRYYSLEVAVEHYERAMRAALDASIAS
jgi:glycosyltransferase involved in cell wall biosynthesis